MRPKGQKKPRPPLDEEALERTALFYVGRYATTRAKLTAYLARKVKERGWGGEGAPSIGRLVERIAGLGYVDDQAFAAARAASLHQRGYGERRIAMALNAAGIEEEDAAEAREQARAGAMESALRFAQRRRIGPYSTVEPDRRARDKAFAAMARAGHPIDVIRRILDTPTSEIPDCDNG